MCTLPGAVASRAYSISPRVRVGRADGATGEAGGLLLSLCPSKKAVIRFCLAHASS